jgi:hypothetical protein
MPNLMHRDWQRAKDNLSHRLQEPERPGPGDHHSIKEALKKLNKNYGPALERISDAYIKGKDADVKRTAEVAQNIAKDYKKIVAPLGDPTNHVPLKVLDARSRTWKGSKRAARNCTKTHLASIFREGTVRAIRCSLRLSIAASLPFSTR